MVYKFHKNNIEFLLSYDLFNRHDGDLDHDFENELGQIYEILETSSESSSQSS